MADADHITQTTELPQVARIPSRGVADADDRSSDDKAAYTPGVEEKGEKSDVYATVYGDDGLPAREELYDITSGKPLPPIPGAENELYQITIRAIVVGSVLGGVVGASNIYLGLKTGWTFGSSLFGAIFGFGIIKAMANLPTWMGGGPFGPKENVIVQTSATSAAGLGIIFIGGVPAMYQLGLLNTPKADLGRWIGFTAVSAFYGMVFALPLRKWYILRLKLVFPSPTATALTIRTLHLGKAGADAASKKIKALIGSFTGAIILRVVSEYAPGVLWDWHVGVWLHNFGWKSALAMDNWGWFYEWTPAFHGAGILAGLNASISFYAGSLLAWAIIGPSTIHNHLTTGKDEGGGWWVYSLMPSDPSIAKTNQVSPRYWLLWVGVLIMIVASFVELGCNLTWMAIHMFKESQKTKTEGEHKKFIDDPMPPESQISWKVWGPMLVIMIIVQVAVLAKAFGMSVGISILAILLGFLWSFIAVQSSGVTDINPVSTTAKASQLVIGGITHVRNYPVVNGYMPDAARLNLLGGCVAGAAAAQAGDMTGDLKTAHLLGAKPKLMFIAQVCGAVVSVFLVPGLFVLFATAYPCILDATADVCSFGIPSVTAWRAVAIAVASKDGLPLPSSSGKTAIGLSMVALATILAKYLLIPAKFHPWVPNWTAIGLAFTLPQTQYGAAMTTGALVSYFWKRKAPYNHDLYAYAIAAGFAAGEGIGGCVNAILTIAGVDGSVHGSAVGCGPEGYCG